MVPDKIYRHELPGVDGVVVTYNEEPMSRYSYDTKYIRKELILDWIEENHKRLVEVHSDHKEIYDEYFNGIVEKIKSL